MQEGLSNQCECIAFSSVSSPTVVRNNTLYTCTRGHQHIHGRLDSTKCYACHRVETIHIHKIEQI